jgi:outer membrane protein insertion porin family
MLSCVSVMKAAVRPVSGRVHLALSFVLVLIAAAAATAIGATDALAESGPIIREIKVSGNKLIDPEAVKSHLSLAVGQSYDASKADQSFKALFATGLFQDVHIKLQGSTVVVSVVENPLINRVAFEGNKEIKEDELSKEAGMKARSVYSAARAQVTVQRLLDVYRSHGYYAAQIDAKVIKLDHNRVDLVFEIREGKETKVAAINFIGNQSFSDKELRGVVSTTQSGLLDFLTNTSVYDPNRLNYDRDLLRRFYLKKGFADMRIVSAVADADRDGKGFFLTFTIDEGPRYTFGKVDLEMTLPALKPDTLRDHLLTHSGEVYNAELIEKTVETLTAALAKEGEPFAQIRPRIERDQVTRTISVVYVADQGPRVYIERINITGNTRTHDYVILREFRIAEGDAYNKVMVDAARERLMRLGFFKDVKISKETGSAPDRVALNVAVEEKSTGELSFGAGYSMNDGPIGDITYTERNLMGTGQYLQVKLQGSFVGGSFDIAWTDPHFLDSNMSFGVDAFARAMDYTEATGYIVAGYADLRYGASTSLSAALSDNLTVKTTYTLMWEDVYDVDSDAPLAVKELQGTALISSIGYSLIYDTRNNSKKPTSGFYFKGTQDLAGVGGDVDYLRSTVDMRAYYPVTNDVTLAVRATGGTISGWGGQDVRVTDAFYLGGETIPGFAPGGLGPRDATTGDALGGTTYYATTADLRFPLPFVPQDLGLSGAVFTSAGSVFGTNAQQFASQYVATHGGTNTLAVQNSSIVRASTGASLIWDSPIGPLRADAAFVVSKAPYDKTQTITFGYSPW